MDDEDYEEKPVPDVGYRKPPKAYQFKKGQSGNPKGRPRKAKKTPPPPGLTPLTSDIILAEARRVVPVRDGAKVQDLDTLQAMVRSLNVTGLKGNRRALVDGIKLARLAEEAAEKDWTALMDSVIQYKQTWKEQIAYCRENRLPEPDPVPHPDDVGLDYVNRRLIFNGPSSAEEKAVWDSQRAHRDDHAWETAELKKICREEGVELSDFAHLLAVNAAVIQIHDGMFPGEKIRRAPGFNIHEWRKANGVQAQLRQGGFQSFMPPEFRTPRHELDEEIARIRKLRSRQKMSSGAEAR